MQEYFLTFYSKGFSTNVYYFGDLITTKDKIKTIQRTRNKTINN